MRALLLALCVIALAACQPAPDFVDLNGKGYRYDDFAGKWLVVNYWATWCGPCIKEIPELNRLAEEHGKQLVVLGVNYDEPEGEDALRQARKMRIEFPVFARAPHERLGIAIPEVLPTTFVFAPGLHLKQTLVGPQTESSILAVIRPGSG